MVYEKGPGLTGSLFALLECLPGIVLALAPVISGCIIGGFDYAETLCVKTDNVMTITSSSVSWAYD